MKLENYLQNKGVLVIFLFVSNIFANRNVFVKTEVKQNGIGVILKLLLSLEFINLSNKRVISIFTIYP